MTLVVSTSSSCSRRLAQIWPGPSALSYTRYMTRVIGWVFVVVIAAALPASASSHGRNAGIVWAEGSAIWGARSDGSDKRLITTYIGGKITNGFNAPAWSPSGQVLAYGNCASDSCWIHLVSPASASNRTLPGFGLTHMNEPAWSPDGRELAFSASHGYTRAAGSGIFVVSLSAHRLRTITPVKRERGDDSPDWSPDGKTIAFTREVTGQSPVIYLVGQDGRNLRRLTRGKEPSWSPSGRSLVFAWGDGIYSIRANGAARTRLARVPGAKRLRLLRPRWSPDGRKILYMTSNRAIWTMNVNGTERERIVVRPAGGYISDAAWRPG